MHKWKLNGFEAMSKGSFGNAGQNIYVSKKGVLQRIWQFDVNSDGYVDLLIANSHAYSEHPEVYVYSNPTGEAKLQKVLTQGSKSAKVADINGDGYDDLVISICYDGHHSDMSSYVYFGGKDGITENRKIDLAAKGSKSCAVGDFNGDGKNEIVYLIEDGGIYIKPESNPRIRIYNQAENGFEIDDYKDYPAPVEWFLSADIDGDGCDDLYCRTTDGGWMIIWGGPDGLDMENTVQVGVPTDDKARFKVLEMGGGNTSFADFARPKIVKLGCKTYVLYADAQKAELVSYAGKVPGEKLTLNIPNVQSVATGHIGGKEALVVLQLNSLDDQHALIYLDGNYERPVRSIPILTPRDVMLYDFDGNGSDDIVIVQGRSKTAYTSESLLFITDEKGCIAQEPRRFVTHDAVETAVADFSGCGKKSLVFVNHSESFSYGHVPVYVYLNSQNGFSPENKLEFPGHSAGTMMPIDFNDDGITDLLILQNAEDQPHLKPPADLYWGSEDGFDLNNLTQLEAPLAWGGHCADIDKDGYLDIIATCINQIRIFHGSEKGYTKENMQILELPVPEGERSSALWPALADLNGNGWLDMIVPVSWQNYSFIFWGGPEGYSSHRVTKLPIECALTVRVADLNKNGYPDLIFGSRASVHKNLEHEGTVTIFWGGPKGYSGFNCCVLPSYQSNCITIADFTGDGWLDIFASSYFNGRERDVNSYIYWNDKGKFSVTNRKRMFSHSSSAAWACDFNEDGHMDICVTHHRAYGNHIAESAIWWNGPAGFKEENRTWLPTYGPHDMVPNDQGDVMNRSPEETYITPAATVEDLRSVGWRAELGIKTWVNCQIRTAQTLEELENAPFVGYDGTDKTRFGCDDSIPAKLVNGKYLQIKLFLGAVNSGNTPRVTEIYAD